MPQVTTNYPGTINFPTETEGAFEDIIYGAPCNLEIRYVGHEGLLYRRSRWQHHQLRRPPGRRLTTGCMSFASETKLRRVSAVGSTFST